MSTSGASKISQRILDKYDIRKQLGQGSSGCVMLAERKFDARPVALKLLRKSRVPIEKLVVDTDPAGRQIVLPMEVYILHRLSHKNIIRLVDFDQDLTYFYLVTELFGHSWQSDKASKQQQLSPATDLFECIETMKFLPEDKALKIFRQLVDAMTYLQSMNVYHLDIKDENIVIDSDFNIKLIDFGSAQILAPTRKASDGCPIQTAPLSRFFGTLTYAPPEVLLGQPFQAGSTDIWACGCLLYAMLYGQLPFASAEHAIANIYSRLRYPSVSVSQSTLDLLDSMLLPDVDLRASLAGVGSRLLLL